jgi:hypothetical protein
VINTPFLLVGLPALGGALGIFCGFLTDRPEDGEHTLAPWFGIVGAVIGFVVGALISISSALAHDGPTPLDAWYRSLTTPTGYSCCNTSDCSPVEAKIDGDHWSAQIDGIWRPVPPEVILKRENMDGRPIACIYRGEFRCFIPSSAS